MTTEIKWRAEDADESMSTMGWINCILLGGWADCEANAEAAVGDVVTNWFDDKEWDRWFPEQTRGTIVVEICEPTSIAGKYDVDLERVTKAHVTALRSTP